MKFKQTLLTIAVSMALSATAVSANTDHEAQENSAIKHVLLISVDGLHQNDLDWFVQNNPNSAMAAMVTNGISYNNARTQFPSDSFPGMVGQTTGGNPKTTGIYYDDAYSRGLLPFGTSKADCQGKIATPGTAVTYAENIEPLNKDGNFVLDATQGIAGLYPVSPAPELTSVLIAGDTTSVPPNILKLASGADDVRNNLIDPAQLPVDPVSCNPVYPHQYLQVNTIFEVAHAKGLRTAWTDKHPAYEILNGPSGYGIDDLFAPEINSVINLTDPSAPDWTKNNINTQQYDTIKVLSVINEIKGFDHSGINKHGTPAIFGMNFQAVSTAQKLNTSTTPEHSSDPTQTGGYTNNGTVPGPVLQSALHFVDDSLKQMQAAIKKNTNTQSNTVIILSAKHGQSPQDRSKLTIINDGTMIDALNTAWAKNNPGVTLVAHAMDDDGVLLWLNDRSAVASSFAKSFLMNYNGIGIGSDAHGNKTSNTFTSAGLSKIYAGIEAAKFIGVDPSMDQRAPDVIGIAQEGSVYGGGKLSKIAEHGGNSIPDRAVPIVVSGAGIGHLTVTEHVDTIQIAPTILHLLGLNPEDLKAVKIEKTQVLPELN
jgi:hypothetical protein